MESVESKSPSQDRTEEDESYQEDDKPRSATFRLLVKLLQIQLHVKSATKYAECANICDQIASSLSSTDMDDAIDWGAGVDALRKLSL